MKMCAVCEESLVVRKAFAARGWDAWSCDLLPRPGQHLRGDARNFDWSGFDLLICFPPCTYLCRSGQRWLKDNARRWRLMEAAAAFVAWLLSLPCRAIALENPRMHCHAVAVVGPSSQKLQPWMFGHGEVKETHLWLRGVPPLKPTNVVMGRESRVHHESPGPMRARRRSRTFPGIAEAMATQWTEYLTGEGHG